VLAEQAVALARQADDAGDRNSALRILHATAHDLASSVRGLNEAHREAVELTQQAPLEHILRLLYFRGGLCDRASRLMRHTIIPREPGLTGVTRTHVWSPDATLESWLKNQGPMREAVD
jgi:hypothetical protein